jgi:soluble lytic murein transglycosylase-like protein
MKRIIAVLAILSTIGTVMPASAADLQSLINQAADQEGVPRHIAHGVIRVESAYNCHNRNRHSGASGIMQVLPATARGMGVHGSLFDCWTGLQAGMRYLREALTRGGTGCAGVSLYNLGIFAKPRCTSYGRKVLRAASLRGQEE